MSTREKVLSDFDAGRITFGEAVSRIARLITAENVAAIMAAIRHFSLIPTVHKLFQ